MKAYTNSRRHSTISYTALGTGIICFFLAFVPFTRMMMQGSVAGDLVTFGFTVIGFIISVIGITKEEEKNLIPFIALFLSLSVPIFFVLIYILMITHIIAPAP